MKFENVDKKYVDQAVEIALKEYNAECTKCPQLIKKDMKKELEDLLTGLFNNGYGKVAIEDEKVLGYLTFWGPWEGFHGNVKGVFSPLGGSGFSGGDRRKLASQLFEAVGNDFIQEEICAYAVSRYAHDEEVGRAFIFNGFGIRCSDAMMKLADRKIPQVENETIMCKEVFGEEKKQILELKKGLTTHLSRAPIFFPTDLKYYYAEGHNEELRLFIAKEQDEIIGFIMIDTEGENFITDSGGMYNLGSTFVKEEYRGQKVTEKLLEYICNVCQEESMKYLGVDFETLNPKALRFWGKYFESYTYSYYRRVDERSIGYEKYMSHYFN